MRGGRGPSPTSIRSNLPPIPFARSLARRGIPAEAIGHGVLGFSVPQAHSFYGLPWVAGRAGLGHIAGPTIMQACATGVRTLLAAAQEIEAGMCGASLAITCDRTSNGPHLYYPNPKGPGGTGAHEDWVMDNFGCDPLGSHSMLQTAENVAAKHQITTEQQHEVVLLREKQYRDALADGCAFQKRYMSLPFEVPDACIQKDRRHDRVGRGNSLLDAGRLGRLEAGAGGRHRDLRRADPSGRRQRRDHRRRVRREPAN